MCPYIQRKNIVYHDFFSLKRNGVLALDPGSCRAPRSVPSVERFALSAVGSGFNPLSSDLMNGSGFFQQPCLQDLVIKTNSAASDL